MRTTRLVIILTLASLASAGGTATARPVAGAARSCSAPKYPGVGYFTSLHVSRTSCSRGAQLAIAWYGCRTRHGKAGRCTSSILGYRCSESRKSISTEIDARVTCQKGRAIVTHTYQQDL